MAVPIKSPQEIVAMRPAAALAWALLGEALTWCQPGVTTGQIDRRLADRIASAGAEAVLHGRRETPDGQPFPGCCCICVNEEAAHGVPGPRILRDGDAVCIDLALRLHGWHADAARACVVGAGSAEARRLVQAAAEGARAGAAAAACGARWSSVARAVAGVAESRGVRLADGLCGHGIGKELHEPPRAGYADTGLRAPAVQDFVLRPGMVLTIEPVFLLPGQGRPTLRGLDDGFTVVTADRAWACHEELMVAVTRGGPELLTV